MALRRTCEWAAGVHRISAETNESTQLLFSSALIGWACGLLSNCQWVKQIRRLSGLPERMADCQDVAQELGKVL